MLFRSIDVFLISLILYSASKIKSTRIERINVLSPFIFVPSNYFVIILYRCYFYVIIIVYYISLYLVLFGVLFIIKFKRCIGFSESISNNEGKHRLL